MDRRPLPTRARVRNAGNVITLDIHRSELENASRFGFAVTAVALDAVGDAVVGIDFAPDNGSFWRYTLANKAALRLLAAAPVGAPKAPALGSPSRSHCPCGGRTRTAASRAARSGARSADGIRVRATGTVDGGRARCSLAVPNGARRSWVDDRSVGRRGGHRAVQLQVR